MGWKTWCSSINASWLFSDHYIFQANISVAASIIGSDDMLALVARGQYGFNQYVGGYVPFYRNRMRDRDGIAGLNDKCPEKDFPQADPDDDGNGAPNVQGTKVQI